MDRPTPDSDEDRVSVIIPCFNRGYIVADAVESALAQEPPVREIICVDDGSTDDTVEVLERLAAEYPGRITIVPGDHRGAAAARNRGVAAASGEYLQFLDSDDVLLPGKIRRQVAVAVKGAADLVAGGYEVRPLEGEPYERTPSTDDVWRGLFFGDLGITSANLFRRRAVADVGGWDEERTSSQEYELMFRMVRHGHRSVRHPFADTVVRRQGDSIFRWEPNQLTAFIELRIGMAEHASRIGAFEDSLRRDALERTLVHIRKLADQGHSEEAERMFERIRRGVRWSGVPATRSTWLTAARLLGYRRVERLRSHFSR